MHVWAQTQPEKSYAPGPTPLQQGTPPQGVPPQAVPPQGVPPQGVPPQGVPPQGVPLQGTPLQGTLPQGTHIMCVSSLASYRPTPLSLLLCSFLWGEVVWIYQYI